MGTNPTGNQQRKKYVPGSGRILGTNNDKYI